MCTLRWRARGRSFWETLHRQMLILIKLLRKWAWIYCGTFIHVSADFSFELLDYRQLRFVYDENGMLGNNSRLSLDGDPNGYTVFDLGKNSAFEGLENIENIYGADYDRSETLKHHSGGKHEYCISGTILKADVFISLPKMKTHRKSGATLNLKNLVGCNGNKNYLPHFLHRRSGRWR